MKEIKSQDICLKISNSNISKERYSYCLCLEIANAEQSGNQTVTLMVHYRNEVVRLENQLVDIKDRPKTIYFRHLDGRKIGIEIDYNKTTNKHNLARAFLTL